MYPKGEHACVGICEEDIVNDVTNLDGTVDARYAR